jgi:hypothetical protein
MHSHRGRGDDDGDVSSDPEQRLRTAAGNQTGRDRPRQRATARRIVKINQANKTSKSKKTKTIKLKNRFHYNQDGELDQGSY